MAVNTPMGRTVVGYQAEKTAQEKMQEDAVYLAKNSFTKLLKIESISNSIQRRLENSYDLSASTLPQRDDNERQSPLYFRISGSVSYCPQLGGCCIFFHDAITEQQKKILYDRPCQMEIFDEACKIYANSIPSYKDLFQFNYMTKLRKLLLMMGLSEDTLVLTPKRQTPSNQNKFIYNTAMFQLKLMRYDFIVSPNITEYYIRQFLSDDTLTFGIARPGDDGNNMLLMPPPTLISPQQPQEQADTLMFLTAENGGGGGGGVSAGGCGANAAKNVSATDYPMTSSASVLMRPDVYDNTSGSDDSSEYSETVEEEFEGEDDDNEEADDDDEEEDDEREIVKVNVSKKVRANEAALRGAVKKNAPGEWAGQVILRPSLHKINKRPTSLASSSSSAVVKKATPKKKTSIASSSSSSVELFVGKARSSTGATEIMENLSFDQKPSSTPNRQQIQYGTQSESGITDLIENWELASNSTLNSNTTIVGQRVGLNDTLLLSILIGLAHRVKLNTKVLEKVPNAFMWPPKLTIQNLERVYDKFKKDFPREVNNMMDIIDQMKLEATSDDLVRLEKYVNDYPTDALYRGAYLKLALDYLRQ